MEILRWRPLSLLERATYSLNLCFRRNGIFDGALAGIAGGYAFYTIFEPREVLRENPIDMQTVFYSNLFLELSED
jgi:hypothetical protein